MQDSPPQHTFEFSQKPLKLIQNKPRLRKSEIFWINQCPTPHQPAQKGTQEN